MRVILAVLALAAVPLVADAFAYLPNDGVFIFVQSTLRDSSGTLVAYLESTKFTNVNGLALDSFLDHESRPGDPVITAEGKQYQVIRRVQAQVFHTDGLVASTMLSDVIDNKAVPLVRFAHDGYPTAPGDTLKSIWTFIRPIPGQG